MLAQEMSEVNTICDLGCGNGYIANQLSSLGYTVIGVDASKSGIEIARQHNYVNEIQGKATFVQSTIDKHLRVRSRLPPVDLVVSCDVIEHLYRPAELFEAAEQLLKPNGHILVTAPYHGYLKNLALSLSGKMENHFSALHDGGHIKFFSVKTLSVLMRRHSFRDLRFSYYGRAPWLWKNMLCHARRTD